MRSARTRLLLATAFALLAGAGDAVAAVTPTGSLGTARTQAAGVAVPAGSTTSQVIVTGGFDATSPAALTLGSTERYDVASGGWLPGAPMKQPRAQHHAFFLPSVTRLRGAAGLLVIGGVQLVRGTPTAVAQPELYDIAGDAWVPGVAVTPPRQRDTATLISGRSGEPLIVTAGGITGGTVTNTVDRYDVENDAWGALAPMATARRDHAAVALPDGRILVAGGVGAAGVPLGTTEIYDPVANTWKPGPPLATPRTDLTLTLVDAKTVVATGGFTGTALTAVASSEVIDPTFLSTYPTTPNAWADAGTMAVARGVHAATLVRSGWLAVSGGRSAASPRGLDSAESWTPAARWGGLYATPGSSTIGGARLDHVAAAIPQTGQVLLAGGGVVAGNAAPSVTASAVLWSPDAAIVPPTTPPVIPEPTTPLADPQPSPQPVQPTEGRTFVAGRASGNVFVRIGTTDEYRELTQDEGVPFGTVIDATDGHVRVTAVVDGVLQTAEFWGGTFVVKQAKDGWIEVRLFGKLKCKNGKPVTAKPKQAVRLVKRKSKPKAWGNGKGKFRTKGVNSTASVRGTKWLVEERCSGTFTKVKRGSVRVRDFPKHKTVIVKAGKNYLARPRPRR